MSEPVKARRRPSVSWAMTEALRVVMAMVPVWGSFSVRLILLLQRVAPERERSLKKTGPTLRSASWGSKPRWRMGILRSIFGGGTTSLVLTEPERMEGEKGGALRGLE